MNLIRITDLSEELGLSSRTLRYYEEAGLISSVRPKFEKYRYYDEKNIERLKQIIILRKMQIPIKDIVRIYESQEMSVITQVFVDKIKEIDSDVIALSELKRIVNEFLEKMIEKGIRQITALPLLYEEMDRQLSARTDYNIEHLNVVSEKLNKPLDTVIISLPRMRVLSSYLKENSQISDTYSFSQYLQRNNIKPENHERFEFQDKDNEIVIIKIADDFQNDTIFVDFIFDGGLFAMVHIYLDEDLGAAFRSLIKSFDDNKFYQIDYSNDGSLRCPAMLENLISPDDKRELVAILVPVKKRLPDPALFDPPKEITDITIAKIEEANPVLWSVNVPLDKLKPVSDWSYRVNQQNEGEYTPVGDQHYLSTGVEVKLPFRIDINFKVDNSTAAYGHGSDEGNFCFHHGASFFGINKGNFSTHQDESITFTQPIFGNNYTFRKRGKIDYNTYNRLTWIVGEKHFAVIINNEIRYCGVNFPYMTVDFDRQSAKIITISGNGTAKRFFKSVHISQLSTKIKTKMRNGELTVIIKQSNNIIPKIHKFITSEHGENYWFNGCGRYVMNALGENDYDYEFFAGLTGDVFAQIFTYNQFRGDGVTDYILSEGQQSFIEDIFNKCGYASTFVQEKQLKANKEMYLQTLLAYIDKGVPVISNLKITGHIKWIVFVGYEEYGKTLLFMTDNMTEPERVSTEEVFCENNDDEGGRSRGFIFVGEKKKQKELKQIYRETIVNLPKLLTTKTENYCFGALAFRAWADEIENGKYDNMKPEEFDSWFMYSNYVCNLATNGSCCHEFLNRAKNQNPDMVYLDEIKHLYRRIGAMWNNDNGTDLEALGGGFNITLEALQDKDKRSIIAAKIREFAVVTDEIVRVLEENIKENHHV